MLHEQCQSAHLLLITQELQQRRVNKRHATRTAGRKRKRATLSETPQHVWFSTKPAQPQRKRQTNAPERSPKDIQTHFPSSSDFLSHRELEFFFFLFLGGHRIHRCLSRISLDCCSSLLLFTDQFQTRLWVKLNRTRTCKRKSEEQRSAQHMGLAQDYCLYDGNTLPHAHTCFGPL